MSKLALIGKMKTLYERGENILEFMKAESGGPNDAESIMISYDFQAGSYTQLAQKNAAYLDQYTDAIQNVLAALPVYSSIMEVGVGEATLMNPLMAKIDPHNKLQKFGFDISWSRTRYARQNTDKAGTNLRLFMANLFDIPLPDNAIDIVYTSHSLEPNGGKEREALQELYRVANRYVVLLEPDFQNASEESKARMQRHGYVRDLAAHAEALNFEVVEHRPFDIFINPLNPTGLTIIKKNASAIRSAPSFICPVTKTPLVRHDHVYFSSDSGLMYPIIDDIPCLLDSHAILGLHFANFR
ncbi:MAG TPA: methyltransferase domain-containing protein [Burkholderiaceae bacterium]|nr:methyltransferase domain-containing protein [Burkholderiaceae bacterium]